MEQMLLGWHASAERMLQSSWFDKSLEECRTFCVLQYHCWYLADQSFMLAFKPWCNPVLEGFRCPSWLQAVKLSPMRPSRM